MTTTSDPQYQHIRANYAGFPDHLLRDVVKRNRTKWATRPGGGHIRDEQLLVAQVAADLLAEREQVQP